MYNLNVGYSATLGDEDLVTDGSLPRDRATDAGRVQSSVTPGVAAEPVLQVEA